METTIEVGGATASPMKRAKYAAVNATWPDDPPVPTGPEAIRGARLLIREGYRFHGYAAEAKRKRKFKLTSGRRHTWPRRGIWYINPDERRGGRGGWEEIVHSISHVIHQRVNPGMAPHQLHAMTEQHLIEYVLKSGWLDGKLKRPEKPKPERDVKAERHQRVLAAIKRWETKAKRAETALRKLRRQKARYEKV